MRSNQPFYPWIVVLALLSTSMLMAGTRAAAQTENVLYNFNSAHGGMKNPWLSVVLDGAGNLYGTAQLGGTYGYGGVFELVPQTGGGWAEKSLFNFNFTNGATPVAGLVFDAAGNLYGATNLGGTYGAGTVFELTPTASGPWTHKTLHSFGSSGDGQRPLAGPIFDGLGNLYGTTSSGGTNGTVYDLIPNSDGSWTENVLHSFGSTSLDGQNPNAGLVFDSAGNLYGETGGGGAHGGGTVWELSPNSGGGWTEKVLHSFPAQSEPESSLVMDSAGNLYGTTALGGTGGWGTAFELTKQSNGNWNETLMHNFSSALDGFNVFSGLTFDSEGNLYGATLSGGAYSNLQNGGYGTIFKLTPGTGGTWNKSTVFSFDGTDGSGPGQGNLVSDGSGHWFGGAGGGGAYGGGVVFEIIP